MNKKYKVLVYKLKGEKSETTQTQSKKETL
jgi:hypothetical protein